MDKTRVIDKVTILKQAYDRQRLALEANFKMQVELAKRPVIEAINEALQAGVSKNKVAIQGMGYKGIAPMQAFMGAKSASIDDLVAALEKYSLPTTESIVTSTKFERDQVAINPTYNYFTAAGRKLKIRNFGAEMIFDQIKDEDPENAQKVISDFIAEFGDQYSYDEQDLALANGPAGTGQ